MPIFFEEEMNRLQRELAHSLTIGLTFGVTVLACAVIAGFFLHAIFFAVAMLCGIVTCITFVTLSVRAATVGKVVQEWREANSEVPDMDITDPTVVHWPNFFVAKYGIDKPQDVLRESEWKLAGIRAK